MAGSTGRGIGMYVFKGPYICRCLDKVSACNAMADEEWFSMGELTAFERANNEVVGER